MPQAAGYVTTVKKAGAAVAFTNEPTTKLTANTVYQITDTTKQVLDPAVSVTVQVDADGPGAGGYVTASPSTYTINWYTGTITFASDQGASALVRVSGSYVPLLTVATARSSNIKLERTAIDTSAFSASAWKVFTPGMLSLSGDLELIEDGLTDHDPGAGTQRFVDDLVSANAVLLEIRPGNQGSRIRTWATLTAVGAEAPMDDMVRTPLTFRAAGRGTAPSAAYA